MPPTFIIYMQVVGYILLNVVVFLFVGPAMLLRSARPFAKKLIATTLLSLPILVVVQITSLLVGALPGLAFIYCMAKLELQALIGIALLVFIMLVGVAFLYVWYVASRIAYNSIDGNFLDSGIESSWLCRNVMRKVFRNWNWRQLTPLKRKESRENNPPA